MCCTNWKKNKIRTKLFFYFSFCSFARCSSIFICVCSRFVAFAIHIHSIINFALCVCVSRGNLLHDSAALYCLIVSAKNFSLVTDESLTVIFCCSSKCNLLVDAFKLNFRSKCLLLLLWWLLFRAALFLFLLFGKVYFDLVRMNFFSGLVCVGRCCCCMNCCYNSCLRYCDVSFHCPGRTLYCKCLCVHEKLSKSL